MTAAATAEELVERADELAQKFRQTPALDLARASLNEAGVLRARRDLETALDGIGAAQESLIRHNEDERRAKEAVDAALLAAEWDLAGCFTVKANKQWLVKTADKVDLAEDQQRSMTADEKKAWLAAEAAKTPEARAATKALRDAEHNVALSRADLNLAERRFSACKADLTAAVATLNALVAALPARSAS